MIAFLLRRTAIVPQVTTARIAKRIMYNMIPPFYSLLRFMSYLTYVYLAFTTMVNIDR
jgi:hypothetical protein